MREIFAMSDAFGTPFYVWAVLGLIALIGFARQVMTARAELHPRRRGRVSLKFVERSVLIVCGVLALAWITGLAAAARPDLARLATPPFIALSALLAGWHVSALVRPRRGSWSFLQIAIALGFVIAGVFIAVQADAAAADWRREATVLIAAAAAVLFMHAGAALDADRRKGAA